MKVCLLNESFPPVIDGVVNVMMNYADYMMKDYGAKIAVGTPRYPGADYTSYPYKVVPYQSFDTAKLASGYRAGNPFDGKYVSELTDFHPDIIHAHCPASALVIGRILREQTGAPIVFTYHTKYDIDIMRWVKVKAIAQEGINAYVGNIEACDEVWTVSRGAGESLKSLGFTGDYRVMNNGVDFDKGRVDPDTVAEVTAGYDLPQGVPMFLFVGRIITYKGLPLILDALKMVADAGQDFRMVFVGKGPDQEMLTQKAADLGIGDKCIFVGPVYDRDKLRAWNTRADLFLFPSTFDTNGLVVREAAACGLASVLIKDSCASEGITDGRNGFIIEENAESMAALLKEVSKDLNHLYDVGQHAMDEIYLSWRQCVAEAYERYQVILDRKQAGLLPQRSRMLTDYLVEMTAQTMENQDKARRARKELFHDFKETAVGMMENFQEMEEQVQEAKEELQDKTEHAVLSAKAEMKESLQETKAAIQAAGEEAEEKKQLLKTEVKESLQETKAAIQAAGEAMEEKKQLLKAEMKENLRELKNDLKESLTETKESLKESKEEAKKLGQQLDSFYQVKQELEK